MDCLPASGPNPAKTLWSLAALWFLLALLIATLLVARRPQIEIEWETESEFQTAGFNVYRSETEGGEYVKVNEVLIASMGDAVTGARYVFEDTDASPGETYFYQLEDVELDGTVQRHEILVGSAPSNALGASLATLSAVAGLALFLMGLKRRET